MLVALVAACLLAVPVAALLWFARRDTPVATAHSDEPDAPLPDDPPPPDDVPPPPQQRTEEELRAAMRLRYRPGPFARVDAMIPGPQTDPTAHTTPHFRPGRIAGNPWMVQEGAFLMTPPPSPQAGAAVLTAAPGAEAVLRVLPGVPARVSISLTRGDSPITGFYVSFPGYPGSFYLPGQVQTELGPVLGDDLGDATVHFGIDAPLLPNGGGVPTGSEPFAASMRIVAVDAQGRASGALEQKLEVMPTGTGDVEVALTMTEATDLDLYVVEPTGTCVYYGNTSTPAGGRLDLDANAACSSNLGVNNEHVFWAAGRAPQGTYTVRIAHFESCIDGRPVDWRVTIRNCGETVVLSGRFSGEAQTEQCMSSLGEDGRGWCQDVVSFEAGVCAVAGGGGFGGKLDPLAP